MEPLFYKMFFCLFQKTFFLLYILVFIFYIITKHLIMYNFVSIDILLPLKRYILMGNLMMWHNVLGHAPWLSLRGDQDRANIPMI